MELSRKDFLKAAAGATGMLLLQPPAVAMARDSQTTTGLAMLIDVDRCVNCWWCYAACKEFNGLPQTLKPDLEHPPELSAGVWTTLHPVKTGERWTSRKEACNHCTDAACVEVCPTGALSYNELGFVQYDKGKCSGCGYCTEYCPFGVPQMETNTITGVAVMNKCTFCMERVINGESTACAAACTQGAITFGQRSELIAEGEQRVEALRQSNLDAMLYGINELGGLHVMYVLDAAPGTYGLPEEPEVPVTGTVRSILGWLGSGLGIVAVAGFALNYFVARVRIGRGAER